MGIFILWGVIAAVVVFFTRLYNESRNIGRGSRVSNVPMILAGVIGVLAALVFTVPAGIFGAVVGAVLMGLAARFL